MAENPRNDEITLGVLSAVEADAQISQRVLSHELGMALGLANAYLKRCVRKGYIKIQSVPKRRYAYYLTPHGFAEKTRLTGEYLSSSLHFFRRARRQMDEIMQLCAERGWKRIALAGASELAEIASVTAHDHDIVLVGVIDATHPSSRFCGMPVDRKLSGLGHVDAVIVTHTREMDRVMATLKEELGEERIFAPRLVMLAHINERSKRSRAGTGGHGARGAKAAGE